MGFDRRPHLEKSSPELYTCSLDPITPSPSLCLQLPSASSNPLRPGSGSGLASALALTSAWLWARGRR